MDAVQEILDMLGRDYGPDHWADVVKPDVGGRLERLPEEGWAGLRARAAEQPAGVRARLADALVLVERAEATDLLVGLLGSPEPLVGGAAAETLLEKNYRWTPGVSLRADLLRHREGGEGSARRAIDRLLARLPT